MNKEMHKFRVYCQFADGKKGYVYFDLAEGLKAALSDLGCDFSNTKFLSDVEQCTGLEDKQGVLIFENDYMSDSSGKLFIIEWCQEKLGFVARNNNPNDVLESLDITHNVWQIFGSMNEKIGTIRGRR